MSMRSKGVILGAGSNPLATPTRFVASGRSCSSTFFHPYLYSLLTVTRKLVYAPSQLVSRQRYPSRRCEIGVVGIVPSIAISYDRNYLSLLTRRGVFTARYKKRAGIQNGIGRRAEVEIKTHRFALSLNSLHFTHCHCPRGKQHIVTASRELSTGYY